MNENLIPALEKNDYYSNSVEEARLTFVFNYISYIFVN